MTNNSLPSIKTLFHQTWEHFVPRWKKLVLLQLIGVAMIIGVVVLGVALIVGTAALSPNNPFGTWVAAIPLIGVILAMIVGVIYLSCWMGVALLLAITDRAEGIKATFKTARPLIWGYFRTTFVMQLLLGLLFLLLIVPGVLFCVWWSVTIPVFLLEKKSGWAAMKRSKELVLGRWKAVFWRWLVLGGGTFLVAMLLSFLSQWLQQVNTVAGILVAVVQMVVSFVIGTLMMVLTFVLYKHLVETSK